MKKIAIVKALAVLSGITGVAVMLGWFFDIGMLKSILPQWVYMRFTIALSFVLCGWILYFVVSALETESEQARVVLLIPALIILLLMMTLVTPSIFGVFIGIDNWLVREIEGGSVKAVVSGRPPIGTIMAFSLVAIGGLLTFIRSKALRRRLFVIGILVSVLGSLALLGYHFDVPTLYYSKDGVSMGMAIHTAMLFIFLGTGLMLTGMAGMAGIEGIRIMSLRWRLIILMIPIIAIAPMSFIAALNYTQAKIGLQNSWISALAEIAELKVDKIESFFAERISDVKTLQTNPSIKANLPVLVRSTVSSSSHLAARRRLDSQLKAIANMHKLIDIMLVNKEGRVLYASNDQHGTYEEGRPLQVDFASELLKQGSKGVFLSPVFKNKLKDNVFEMMIAAPIHSSRGGFLGIVVLEVDMLPVYRFIQDTAGLGKTGELLLGINNGDHALFINTLRYDPEANLKRKAIFGSSNAVPVQEAVQGRSGSDISVDYRGEEVIASWRYIPSLEWGLVAKIDTKEAFKSLAQLTQMIVMFGLLISIIVAVIVWALARSIIQPIQVLQRSAKRIGEGNLEIHVYSDATDEIGQLSRTFDTMASNLKETMASRDELNKEVEGRKRAQEGMRHAQQDAEHANKAKSDFLARMSHEIRTPMNAIIGLSYLALQTDLTPKQHDYLSKISSSGQSLLRLINDILDFSKIEAGKLELTTGEFTLDDVLNNVSDLIAIKAAEKKLELLFQVESDVPLKLIGDQLRLEEILLNLAGNAVKFTEHGEVIISVRTMDADDKKITLGFSISDTGIGIAKEELLMLFKPFGQAHKDITREHGGTGLGLVISKRLIKMMDGDIQVKSDIGHGSEFSFSASFGSTGYTTTQFKVLPSPDLLCLKVLAIDDNAELRKALKHMLESFSFVVSLADSGEQGVNAAQASTENPYDLLLIDQYMPDGIDGIETFCRIRQLPGYAHVPVVLLTLPYGGEEDFEKAEQAGISTFAYKPVRPATIFDAIKKAMGYKSLDEHPARHKLDAEQLQHVRGARVLLVEDNDINQQVAIELLEQIGCVVEVANNGLEAIEQVRKGSFEIVFMDIQMPKMGGLEATRRIRQLASEPNYGHLSEIPIVAMTAHALVGDREKSIAAGMNDHLTKPLDPPKLLEVLLAWIKPGERPEKEMMSKKVQQADALTQMPMPHLAGIDSETVLKRMGGNSALYIKLLKKFSQTNGKAVKHLRDALTLNDLKHANELAHGIKGVAANLGMNDLSDAAAKLESWDGCKDTEAWQPLLDQFEMCLNTVIQAIEHLEQGMNKTVTVVPDKDVAVIDKQKLSKLLKALESSLETDLGTASKHAEALRSMLVNTEYDEMFRRLEEQIDNFDSDGAREVIHAIEEGTGCGDLL